MHKSYEKFIEIIQNQIKLLPALKDIPPTKIDWINPKAVTGNTIWKSFYLLVKVRDKDIILEYGMNSDTTPHTLMKVMRELQNGKIFSQIEGPQGGKTLCFEGEIKAMSGFYVYAFNKKK